MPLQRKYANVLLDDPAGGEPVEHTVEVRSCDQVKAEREGRQRGVSGAEQPIETGHLWAWAALVRTGVIDEKFTPFLERVLQAEITLGDPVDPTKPAASSDSASASPSRSRAPRSPGGSK